MFKATTYRSPLRSVHRTTSQPRMILIFCMKCFLSQIRRAYRNLATKQHPDKGGDPAAFKLVQTAYEVLSDSSKVGKEADTPKNIILRGMLRRSALVKLSRDGSVVSAAGGVRCHGADQEDGARRVYGLFPRR
jgi:curved DNA-binding protein CbpA